jgi:hypothetical protein
MNWQFYFKCGVLLWQHVILYVTTNVSKETTTTIFRVKIPWPVTIHKETRYRNSEQQNINFHHYENLKSHNNLRDCT